MLSSSLIPHAIVGKALIVAAWTAEIDSMNYVRRHHERCRNDRDVLLATISIAFWVIFGIALFTWHGLVGFPVP
jgi:hypothetical protein